MTTQPGVWGIDLGQCGLKALRLEERDGQMVATAFDYIEHPKILSQPDADPDQLTREALEKFLSRNDLHGDIVAISVPGQSGLARFVKLPPVEEKKIVDIVKFEAKQQIPFNLEEVVWDYQKLGSGVVTDGFAMETEIGLFAMKRDQINRSLQQFRDVSVDIHLIQMAPLALCNFLAFDLLKKDVGEEEEATAGKKKCVVGLDIGTDSSNLVITDGQRIIWQRPIPLGGNHFTRALTKELKLTFAKAEHLKRNATKSPDLKKILTALKPVLNDFVGEVQRSLGYFTNTHRDAEIQYMVGLGNAFRLPGLQRYMSEKLGLEVKRLNELSRISGDTVTGAATFKENILTFAVCYGLALQGLEKARLATNLLPDEIRVERLVRAKKPWAAAAAAAILLGLGMLTFSYGVEWNAYGHESVKGAISQGEQVIGRVTQAASAFDSAKNAAAEEKSAVESIAAGQDERLNWIKLSKFVGDIVPRPEDCLGDWRLRLPESAGLYISDARDSLEVWKQRKIGGAAPLVKEKKDPNAIPKDELAGVDGLIQFNIIGFNALYTDDLSAFWAALPESARASNEDRVRPMNDLENPPKKGEKGWVVELRGYTFHKDRTGFIRNVLMERIWQAGRRSPLPVIGSGSIVGAEVRTGETWILPQIGKATSSAEGGEDGGGFSDETETPAQPKLSALPPRPVSHVILLNFLPRKTSDTSTFELVQASALPQYVKDASPVAAGGEGEGEGLGASMTPPGGSMTPPGGGSMMPPGGEGAMGGTPGVAGGKTRANWRPLIGAGAAAGVPGAEGGFGESGGLPGTSTPPGGVSGMVPPGGVSGSSGGIEGGVPGIPAPGIPAPGVPGTGFPQPGTTQPPEGDSPHTRTEFIILFIWREPTPSDASFKRPGSSSDEEGLEGF